MSGRLAMFGGSRAVVLDDGDRARLAWPVVTEAERSAVLAVLDRGGFTSVGSGGAVVRRLESGWAEFTGTRHCAAVASGTAALELALAAADLEPGAQIVVPALSFVASAFAPLRQRVEPVFADIGPRTFTLDPAAAAAAITPRTRALMAVHLHGLPCEMDELRELAARHELLLVEDAAQAHAAGYRGRQAGALGDIAAFSLNVSKNLPTAGEGGLVTTDDAALHDRVVLHRQFGERIPDRGPRGYVSEVVAGNAKLGALQAAFTLGQLAALPERAAGRDRNIRALLSQLSELPGLLSPQTGEDRRHAWHMLRFRFDVGAMGHPEVAPGAMRAVLERALRAEGVPVRRYQCLPLPAQPALAGREGYRTGRYPVTEAVLEDSLTLQGWHLNPAGGQVLLRCAEAFHKVWGQLDLLASLARQEVA
ncbi:DegT/DnrJ/EryC1/StrS family aminotransferase [Streptomyces sp. NPDC052396]|uniref:DegT/DnrJ/EryC1/StrS family aminotransferase n=1 Tax=Streptomyces sp. NPDC052396 TaxID=3365689 RepID=UPI0037D54EE1